MLISFVLPENDDVCVVFCKMNYQLFEYMVVLICMIGRNMESNDLSLIPVIFPNGTEKSQVNFLKLHD